MTTRRTFLASLPVSALALQDEAGFVSLFDGRSLGGWSIQEGPETAFHVSEGAITVHPGANFPAWLRSNKRYENFDFRGEFFLKGWMDSGIYLHAAEHGRPGWTGFEVKLFHQQEPKPTPYSCGAIFPLVAPSSIKVNNKGEWNTFRIVFDWPSLQVWMNGERVQNLNIESHPELKHRLRQGYLGFQSLSYPIQFRNLRIKELPAKQQWISLFDSAASLDQWFVSEGKPVFQPLGKILRMEGLGHIATKAKYKDFELQTYIRTSRWHNGGVVFRSTGGGTRATRHYEIQLHNVEGAHFPSGSLYHFKRAVYPRIADERWWLLQLVASGSSLTVRINGENVLEYDQLENVEDGHVELQAHANGTWAEFKELKIRTL